MTLAGERLELLPERAAFWERTGTLLIADAHWGKAATFRASGIPVPEGTTLNGLDRLEALVRRLPVRRIVFLGDYLHAREGRAPVTIAALASWGERHARIEQVLVRGNHDRGAGDPPEELAIRCVEPPLVQAPFLLSHFPEESEDGYVLAGHVHPAIRLVGRGRQRERLCCFWIREGCAVLPSFGDFTGSSDVQPAAGDRVFVIAGELVVEIAAR